MVILVILSVGLYSINAHKVQQERVQRAAIARGGIPDRGPILEDYLEQLERGILDVDLVTLVLGGILSCFLAARTLRPVRRAMEDEHKFFINAAHDLRTPLTVMRAEAEVALRSLELSPGAARQVLTSSLEEIGRLSAIVEQLLALARPRVSCRSQRARFQALDASRLACAAAARMAPRGLDRGVAVSAAAEGPVVINADPLSVERAIDNVLENAILYTPSGGKVEVRALRRGSHVEIRISDTGMGIPEEELPHITEAFYRGDLARGVYTGGSGLGLSIVKATMDDHRGGARGLKQGRLGDHDHAPVSRGITGF